MNDDPTQRSQRCQICEADIDEGIRMHLLSRQHRDGVRAIHVAMKQASDI